LSRIVSLVPSITELVCGLGLADQLVGRTGFCIHPAETLRNIPKVGGTKSVNLKKVRSLEPTHVILNVDENTRETADALDEFVPELIVTHPLAPEDNLALYRQIGGAFGKEKEAEALCREFEDVFLDVRRKDYPKRKVLYLIWKDPWMTVSRDTYLSRTLAAFGLQTLPATSDIRYPKVSLEEPWVATADLVLVSTEPYRFGAQHLAEISAKTGKLAKLIDGEMTSWYGSRAIRGLRYLSDYASSL
jgi:ABC-type Fe3+-hydroxamate transport system substrate-binding protein